MPVTAPVTHISRCSLHDGPGIRTVVYLKGCPLQCAWCHNPETWSLQKEILFAPNKCICCGRCMEVCPEHHVPDGNDMTYLRSGCTACGKCAEVCPSLALNVCGEEMTADAVFAQIQKDAHYYASSGGATFSGGECLLHADFVLEIALKCRENGIHTAIESAFYVGWENVEKVLSHIDLFFADLKIPDPEKHKAFTGRDNRLIIENIRRLSKAHDHIILRIPVIPGVNDSEKDLIGFSEIIRTFGSGIQGIEILRYNSLAESKYRLIGKEHRRFSDDAQTDAEMENIRALLESMTGIRCYFV